MRKIVLLEHVSLDGYVAGPNSEMDWIRVDEELFGLGAAITQACDAALYGRKTYEMMAAYWPTAGDRAGATKHDIVHSRWVNAASKYFVSKTLESAPWGNVGSAEVLKGDLASEIGAIKQQPGKDIFLVGSIALSQGLMNLGLIDELWLNVNPVVLGSGLPMFANIDRRTDLKLVESRIFGSGVIGLHYESA